MGIQEVYDELRAVAEKVAAENVKEEKRRKFDEHNEREQREHDAEWAKQVVLLRELQELGIIPLIEEFTGEKLELTEKDGKVYHSYDQPWDNWWKEEDPDKLDEIDKKVAAGLVWGWDISSPKLSMDTGQWNQSLRIIISQVENGGMVSTIYGLNSRAVLLSYSPTREIQIMGIETTFRGLLPEDPTIRTGLVERKLAEALISPMSSSDLNRVLRLDLYDRRNAPSSLSLPA